MTGALYNEYTEALKCQPKGTKYLTVRVRAHKTGTTESAKLVLSPDVVKMMRMWEDIRVHVATDSPYIFPDFKGSEVQHLSRLVERFAVLPGIFR